MFFLKAALSVQNSETRVTPISFFLSPVTLTLAPLLHFAYYYIDPRCLSSLSTTTTTTKPTKKRKEITQETMDSSSLSPNPFDHQKTQNTEPKKSFITSLMTLRSNRFKEDTYFVSELKPSEQKSLQDLKDKLKASSFGASSMWGVSLLGGDDKADVILLKFLRARDFKVTESLRMLEKCLEWREEFKAEKLTEEDLGFKDLEGKVAYMRGYDKEGHPVCYNAYGVFKERDMYESVFGDEEKLDKFLRWRVQVLEKGVKMLHFKPGGVNSIIQVTDLKDMPKRELRVASNQILSLFQDNYPEMVATKVHKFLCLEDKT